MSEWLNSCKSLSKITFRHVNNHIQLYQCTIERICCVCVTPNDEKFMQLNRKHKASPAYDNNEYRYACIFGCWLFVSQIHIMCDLSHLLLLPIPFQEFQHFSILHIYFKHVGGGMMQIYSYIIYWMIIFCRPYSSMLLVSSSNDTPFSQIMIASSHNELLIGNKVKRVFMM